MNIIVFPIIYCFSDCLTWMDLSTAMLWYLQAGTVRLPDRCPVMPEGMHQLVRILEYLRLLSPEQPAIADNPPG